MQTAELPGIPASPMDDDWDWQSVRTPFDQMLDCQDAGNIYADALRDDGVGSSFRTINPPDRLLLNEVVAQCQILGCSVMEKSSMDPCEEFMDFESATGEESGGVSDALSGALQAPGCRSTEEPVSGILPPGTTGAPLSKDSNTVDAGTGVAVQQPTPWLPESAPLPADEVGSMSKERSLADRHCDPSDTPQHDSGETTDADAEGSDVEDGDHRADSDRPTRPNRDPKKQCEHDTECPRPARRRAGQFNGKMLCKRHRDQWNLNNCGPPTWQPIVVSTNDALAAIRPKVIPPYNYRHAREPDESLKDHSNGLHEWTLRFHHAAMTPYDGEGSNHDDPFGLLVHQHTFTRKATSRKHGEYRDTMIGARISLLFPIALRYHQGGAAIYCAGGDNSGYREDTTLSFLERLRTVEAVLARNKRVVMDVIEGRGVEAFVRGPRGYAKRKETNKKGNVLRQERLCTGGADDALSNSSPAGDAKETSVAVNTPPPLSAEKRKRKRALNEGAVGFANTFQQIAPPGPSNTIEALGPVAPCPNPGPSNDTQPHPPNLIFGSAITDAQLHSALQTSDTAQSPQHSSHLGPSSHGPSSHEARSRNAGDLARPLDSWPHHPSPTGAGKPMPRYPPTRKAQRPVSAYPNQLQHQQQLLATRQQPIVSLNRALSGPEQYQEMIPAPMS